MNASLENVKAVFLEAVEKFTPDQWGNYLDDACGEDSDLRRNVQQLLDAHAHGASQFDQGAIADASTFDQRPLEKPGMQIGPYKLLQQIGEGGMGVVWLADQHEPVKRRVALKVIKPGMDTRQVIARFDAERQALSLMDHPNIAKVLDAGTTDYGRPYFVMELVKGQPITKYCDQHQLTPRQRLELFVSACHAIQHAHQKGIIHRDVKPSNVLVAEYDDRPVCKVIDFGVAKALNQPLTEKSMFTGLGQILGTLEYMSPEQAKVNQLDIDTRSDVYSLGVLLYELLTGTTPFNKERLGSAAWDEMLRIIREEEPPKPSTRLSELSSRHIPGAVASDGTQRAPTTSSLASVAALRHTEPAKLTKLVRGELDWIVMKALEKDRGRRYETANGFAMDIQRYLSDEPVQACPPSAAYRFRKFARKHKAGVGAASAALLILLLGLAGLAISNSLIRREQAKTKARADELKLVSDFQAGMLEQVDPTEAGKLLTADVQAKFDAALTKAGVPETERAAQVEAFAVQWKNVNATDAARELIDRTILKPAIDAIDKQFANQPLVDAQLRQVLADRYVDLGLYDAALPLQKRALATRRRLLGDEHPDTLESISNMGGLLRAQAKLVEAEPFYREALDARRRVLGDEDPNTLKSIDNMGVLLWTQGKLGETEPYFYEAILERRRVLGEEHPDTLESVSNMGSLLLAQGKLNEAELYDREALEKRRRVLGEEHSDTLLSISNLGFLLESQGKLGEAEPYCREALEKRRRVIGEEHPDTLISINNLGSLLLKQDKLDEAEPLLREALEKHRRVLGEHHPNTLFSIANLGELLKDQGQLAEAEPFFREALENRRRVLGEEHPQTLISINNLGSLLLKQDNLDEAEPLLREALEKQRRVLGDSHPETLNALNNMGVVFQLQNKLSEAEPYLREVVEKKRRILGEDHPDTLRSISNFGSLLKAQGKLDEAEPFFREALEKGRRVLGEEHTLTLIFTNNLGSLLENQGKPDEAEPLFREALEKRRRVLGEEHKDTANSANGLGALLRDQGKLDEAEPYIRDSLKIRQRLLGEEHKDTLSSVINLAMLHQAQGKQTETIELLVPIDAAARKALVGPDSWRLGRLLMTLGTTHTVLGEFAAAEANLAEAQPIFVQSRGPTNKDTRECTQAIVDLYTAWHSAEPDKGYDTKAAEWKTKLDALSQPASDPIPEN